MKVVIVAGARPNFMKVAPIIAAIEGRDRPRSPACDCLLVHTGQHHDRRMSEVFLDELGIPEPHVRLECASRPTQVEQTAEILRRFSPVLAEEEPDFVLVVGDVNSTLACAIAAAKTEYRRPVVPGRFRPILCHVEAGLRSFDRSMPEELNRVVIDALADIHFITEESARENLLREGVPPQRIRFVGNTMADTLLRNRERAAGSAILEDLGLLDAGAPSSDSPASPRVADYALLTLHRPSNVDRKETLSAILEAIERIAERLPVVFPVHPRTKARLDEFAIPLRDHRGPSAGPERGIRQIGPLGYLDFLCLMSRARLVLTDSGGIQEETTVLGVPCVTLRDTTERPSTIVAGTNTLAGVDPAAILSHSFAKLSGEVPPRTPPLWDGRAGERIAQALAEAYESPDVFGIGR